jgi:hypothetical protein
MAGYEIQRTDDRASMMMSDLAAEIEKQDRLHPAGYPFTRDGVRLGIAAAGDELLEVYEEWRIHKRDLPAGAQPIRGELMQAAAVIMRAVRSIDESEETP